MQRQRRSHDAWAALVAELDQSGDTVAAFAAQRGLNLNTLKWWRSRLRQARPMTLVPVTVAHPRRDMDQERELVVDLPADVRVRMPVRAATTDVGRFLAALARELQA